MAEGEKEGLHWREAGLAGEGGGPKTLRGSAARLGGRQTGCAACLVCLRPWLGGTLDSPTRGCSGRWAGRVRKEGTSVSLGWGLAAERSWHFQIGAWAAPLQDPPLSTAGRLGDGAGSPGAVGTRQANFRLPPLSFSPSSPSLFPSLLPSFSLGPALRGRAGGAALPGAVARPGFVPRLRDWRRKAWASGPCVPPQTRDP